ncbi:MAG: Hpt domain-containing protein [Desulfococcus sp. 4484_241]|nr:MAG: Hpt domain-containing protein [Desulfococcus sp. 4484_241]
MTSGNEDRIVVKVDADLEDLIPGFLENRRDDIAQIKRLLDEGDYEKIARLGHSMKGSGGGYGFDEITRIGGMIEQLAMGRDMDGVRRQLESLSDYLDRVEVVYG